MSALARALYGGKERVLRSEAQQIPKLENASFKNE
jgi:hypothetical protein